MKIAIELDEQEVKGIKAYLSELDNIKAGKKEIQQFIQGEVNALLQAPQSAVSNYINEVK